MEACIYIKIKCKLLKNSAAFHQKFAEFKKSSAMLQFSSNNFSVLTQITQGRRRWDGADTIQNKMGDTLLFFLAVGISEFLDID